MLITQILTMYRSLGIAIMLIVATLLLPRGAVGQVIRAEDFKPDKNGMPGEQRYEQLVEIGPQVKLKVVVEVTVRRNGGLKVANLDLKILDEYDDGAFYVGGLLHTEFVDVSGDGYKDLVVTGTVANTGEKEGDPVTYSTVTSIYVFQAKEKKFKLAFHVGPKLD